MAVVGFAKPSAPQHTAGSSPVVLLRQLGLGSAIALVISNMIGTGIFTSSGYLAGDLGSPFLFLIIWVVGAAFALAGAFCYSELGINFPSSGGEYVYLTRAYGPTWGFMTGWVSFFAGFSAPIAVNALAIADYLGHFWPGLRQENAQWTIGSGALSLNVGPAQALGCALIAVFTLVNCVGLGKVARLQNILTSTKVIVIIAFIVLGFLIGKGDWAHFSMTAVRTSTTPLAGQFVISLFWIYFAYSGWNAATYVAEELKRPERTLPAALAIGTLVVAALYVGLNVMFLYAAPLESLKGITAVASVAAKHLFGPGIAGAFAALVALCVMSSVNAMVTIGPRVYYAMAKNGAFFSVAAKVHPRWHTPMVAILCQGVCAMVMTLTPFRELIMYIGFTLNFFAVMSVASLLIFRRQPGWQKVGVVSFLYPLLPAAFVLMGSWMTIYGFRTQPKVSVAAVLTIATGAVVYHTWLKKSAPRTN